MKKVAVGLSGGVDSAVSALLLKQQGYDVVGVHLVCWPPKSEYLISNSYYLEGEKEKLRKEWLKKNGCHADEDRAAALKTALELNIPFKVLDFSEEYNKRVVDYFYREYEAGRTPNPDVLCNSEIKFGLFLEWALQNGFDYIATGHYAKLVVDHIPLFATDNPASPAEAGHLDSRLEFSPSENPSNSSLRNVATRKDDQQKNYRLFIPADKHKDQTYFLWKLTQKELSHVLFPLGELQKSELRELASKNKLSCANRPDSQGICFIGEVEVGEFLHRRLKENPGNVLDVAGGVIGRHKGIAFYTIGQRGGWEILPKVQKTMGDLGKMYVIEKRAKENTLIVGEREDGMKTGFGVGEINIITKGEVKYVRIRHGGKLVKGSLKDNWVETEEEMFGVASGQSAVFYSENGECLGGGVI